MLSVNDVPIVSVVSSHAVNIIAETIVTTEKTLTSSGLFKSNELI